MLRSRGNSLRRSCWRVLLAVRAIKGGVAADIIKKARVHADGALRDYNEVDPGRQGGSTWKAFLVS